ncbi:hypothetical protein DRP05_08695 [Archaeoglobales archaeon]|nr:MAG: hypothetical protein DRP05_08695 [Archaeoglobales archaeon]
MPDYRVIKILKIAKQFFEDNFSKDISVVQIGSFLVIGPKDRKEFERLLRNLKFEKPNIELEREFERKVREIEREKEKEIEIEI